MLPAWALLILAAGTVPAPTLVALSELAPDASHTINAPDEAAWWEVIEASAPGRATLRWRAGPTPRLVELPAELTVEVAVADHDGAAVADAQISFFPELVPRRPIVATHTARSGRAVVHGLAAGGYRMEVSAPGAARHTVTILLHGPGPLAPIHVRLGPGRTIRGRYVDAAGDPIEGARVVVIGRDYEPLRTTTDRAGGFVVGGVPAEGPLALMVAAVDRWQEAREIGGPEPVLVRAAPGRHLRVTWSGTVPARLLVSTAGSPEPGFFGRIDAGGALALDGLPEHVELLVEAPGVPPLSRTVDGQAEIALSPPAASRLVVRIEDPEGRPMADAELRYAGRLGPPDGVSDESGIVELPAPGRITVDAPAHGQRITIEVGARTDGAATVVRLPAQVAIELAVVDARSTAPIPAFRATFDQGRRDDVEVSAIPGRQELIVRATDGRIELTGLAAGSGFLAIRSDGHRPWESGEIVLAGATPVVARMAAAVELRGIVVDGATGLPVGGVALWPLRLAKLDPWVRREAAAVSDTSGRFRFTELAELPETISALHPNHAPASFPIPAEATPDELRLTLGAGGSLIVAAAVRGAPGSAVRVTHASLPLEQSAKLDPSGGARFEHLAAGRYRVWLRLGGSLLTRDADVREGRVTTIRFEALVAVSGRARRQGLPLPRATLSFTAAAGEQTSVTTTADGGGFATLLPAGAHRVEASIGDGTSPSRRVEVPQAEEWELDLDFTGAAISGTVVDQPDGAPVSGAKLWLRDPVAADPWSYAAETTSDAAGAFRLDGLPDGTFDLWCVAPGRARQRLTGISVVDGQGPEPLTIELVGGGAIAGRILTHDGSMATEAVIHVIDGTGHELPASAASIANLAGQFRIEGLAPGSYALAAEARGFAPAARVDVAVEEGSESRADLVLGLGGRIEVEAPAYRTVELVPPPPLSSVSSLTRRAELDAAGRANLDALAPGRYLAILAGGPVPSSQSIDVLEGLSTTLRP